jgi:hypothetical protein
MANIKKALSDNDKVKIIVEPATDNADREGFVKINGKVIPFGVPMIVNRKDVRAIKSIKEPKKKSSTGVDVKAIMEQLQITQEKANRVARNMEKDGIQNPNGVNIRWKNKYFVRELS